MGLGWFCIQDEFQQFATSSTLWPSSTKAEILASFTVLMIVFFKSHITLFFDSQSTIDGYKQMASPLLSLIRKHEKVLNYTM